MDYFDPGNSVHSFHYCKHFRCGSTAPRSNAPIFLGVERSIFVRFVARRGPQQRNPMLSERNTSKRYRGRESLMYPTCEKRW